MDYEFQQIGGAMGLEVVIQEVELVQEMDLVEKTGAGSGKFPTRIPYSSYGIIRSLSAYGSKYGGRGCDGFENLTGEQRRIG